MRRIRKHPLWARHSLAHKASHDTEKISSLVFLVAETCCWNPLGAGQPCHGRRSYFSLWSMLELALRYGQSQGHHWPFKLWIHPQEDRSAICSFTTLALEHSFFQGLQRKKEAWWCVQVPPTHFRWKIIFQKHSRTFLLVLTSWNINPLFITTPLWLYYVWFLEVVMNSTPLAFPFFRLKWSIDQPEYTAFPAGNLRGREGGH